MINKILNGLLFLFYAFVIFFAIMFVKTYFEEKDKIKVTQVENESYENNTQIDNNINNEIKEDNNSNNSTTNNSNINKNSSTNKSNKNTKSSSSNTNKNTSSNDKKDDDSLFDKTVYNILDIFNLDKDEKTQNNNSPSTDKTNNNSSSTNNESTTNNTITPSNTNNNSSDKTNAANNKDNTTTNNTTNNSKENTTTNNTKTNTSNTKTDSKKTGWVKQNNKWYYYDNNGAMQTGWLSTGGKWYYLASDGKMLTGWQKIKYNGSYEWFYFDENGKMLTGWQKIKYNGSYEWFYFTDKGVMLKGWHQLKWNNVTNWYYFDDAGVMLKGLYYINNKIFYFDNSGVMMHDNCASVDTIQYCFDSNGYGTLKTRINTTKKLRNLGSIVLGNPVITVTDNGEFDNPQGMVVAKDYYVAVSKNSNDTKAAIYLYNKTSHSLINSFNYSNTFGHANDLAYNSKNGTIYVAGNNKALYKYFKLDDALNKKPNIFDGYLKESNGNNGYITAISYDSSNNMTYKAYVWDINVYDSNNNLVKSFKKIDRDTAQGIGSYNGKVIVIRFNGESSRYTGNVDTTRNSIDIYDINGGYYGSYMIHSQDELESISYYGSGKKFAMYFNYSGGIYEVNIDIPN